MVSPVEPSPYHFESPPPLPLPLKYEGEGEIIESVGFDEIHSLRYFAPRAVLVPRLVTNRMCAGRDEDFKPLWPIGHFPYRGSERILNLKFKIKN